jgi:hypothetical protein
MAQAADAQAGVTGRLRAACSASLEATSVAAQHSTAQHRAAQHSTAQHSAVQRSTAQHSTAQHSTAQHSTAQHSTAQHSTAQHNTARIQTAHIEHSFPCPDASMVGCCVVNGLHGGRLLLDHTTAWHLRPRLLGFLSAVPLHTRRSIDVALLNSACRRDTALA